MEKSNIPIISPGNERTIVNLVPVIVSKVV